MRYNTFEDFLEVAMDNLPEQVSGSQLSGFFALLLALYNYDELKSIMVLMDTSAKLGMAKEKLGDHCDNMFPARDLISTSSYKALCSDCFYDLYTTEDWLDDEDL